MFPAEVPINNSGEQNGRSREGVTMTAKETVDIISCSSLWKMLSIKERIDAASYAMKIAGISLEDENVSDLIGEVYAG